MAEKHIPLCRVVLNTENKKYEIFPIDVRLSYVNAKECILTVPQCLIFAAAHEANKIGSPQIGFFVCSTLFSSGSLGTTQRGLRYNCKVHISYSEKAVFIFFEQAPVDYEALSRLIQGIETPFDSSGLMEGKKVEISASIINKNDKINGKVVNIQKIIEKYKEYDKFSFTFWGAN